LTTLLLLRLQTSYKVIFRADDMHASIPVQHMNLPQMQFIPAVQADNSARNTLFPPHQHQTCLMCIYCNGNTPGSFGCTNRRCLTPQN
jgi:hypothetical protein